MERDTPNKGILKKLKILVLLIVYGLTAMFLFFLSITTYWNTGGFKDPTKALVIVVFFIMALFVTKIGYDTVQDHIRDTNPGNYTDGEIF